MSHRQQLAQQAACLGELQRLHVLTSGQAWQWRWVRCRLWSSHLLRRTPWLHLAVIALALCQYQHLQHLYDEAAIRSAAGRVRGALLEMESGQRGYFLTGKRWYAEDYDHQHAILRLRLHHLCVLLPQTVGNEHLCGELTALIRLKIGEMTSSITLANSGQVERALAIVRTDKGLGYMREISTRLDLIRTQHGGEKPAKASCLAAPNL